MLRNCQLNGVPYDMFVPKSPESPIAMCGRQCRAYPSSDGSICRSNPTVCEGMLAFILNRNSFATAQLPCSHLFSCNDAGGLHQRSIRRRAPRGELLVYAVESGLKPLASTQLHNRTL
jgi:hypothetical protein